MASNELLIQTKDLLDLKEDFKCPVCLLIPRSVPIFQCSNGHIVCNQCHSNLTNCPVCREEMGRNRSLIAEKIIGLDRFPVQCKYASDGCPKTKKPAKIESHEDHCRFQPVQCPFVKCRKQLPMIKIVPHMDTHHKVRTNLESNFSDFAYTRLEAKEFVKPTHLTLDGDQFYFVTWRHVEEHGKWYMWVYYLGFESRCDKYIFSIDLTTKSRTSGLSFKGTVLPITMKKEDIIKKPMAAWTFDDETAKFFHDDSKLSCLTVKVLQSPKRKNSGEDQLENESSKRTKIDEYQDQRALSHDPYGSVATF